MDGSIYSWCVIPTEWEQLPQEGPNWLDDWTVPTVPTVPTMPTVPVSDLLDWSTPKPTSSVVQHDDGQLGSTGSIKHG